VKELQLGTRDRPLCGSGAEPTADYLGDAIDAFDRDPIRIDHVHDSVQADAQAVILTTVETIGRLRIRGQRGGRGDNSSQPILILHVAVRRGSCRG
jgi:hypothetical protein